MSSMLTVLFLTICLIAALLATSGIILYIRSKSVVKQRLVDFIYHDIVILNFVSTMGFCSLCLGLIYPR